MNTFDTYKFRPSALGNFISKKDGKLIGHSELDKIRIGWKEDYSSVAIEKGLYNEQDGLNILQQVFYPGHLVLKNKNKFSNEFIEGTPDAIMKSDSTVTDIKNAENKLTFSKAELSWLYEWQLKAYMWLTGMENGRLLYVLTETPEFLMLRLEQKLFYSGHFESGSDPNYILAVEQLREMHDISQLPIWKRFKYWDVKLTDLDVKVMENIVLSGREYLNASEVTETALFEKNKALLFSEMLT